LRGSVGGRDYEFVTFTVRNEIQLVESLFDRRRLQAFQRPDHAWNRYDCPSGTLLIAAQSLLEWSFEEVTDHAKAGRLCGANVARPHFGANVCVIDHEPLSCAQTDIEQCLLAPACFHQIQTDVDVGFEKALAVESRLARPLNADEDDSFHQSSRLRG